MSATPAIVRSLETTSWRNAVVTAQLAIRSIKRQLAVAVALVVISIAALIDASNDGIRVLWFLVLFVVFIWLLIACIRWWWNRRRLARLGSPPPPADGRNPGP
jgi:Ca2+/Na+ antiporter